MEIAADLADFVEEDCKRLYPKLHDEAPVPPKKKHTQGPEGLQVRWCFCVPPCGGERSPIRGAVVSRFKNPTSSRWWNPSEGIRFLQIKILDLF